MNRKEIAEYRKDLRAILAKDTEDERKPALLQLAKDVGAGYIHTTLGPAVTRSQRTSTGPGTATTIHQDPISESELVSNINNALQTETMIDVCNVSARNFWIAIVATIIALGACVATWINP